MLWNQYESNNDCCLPLQIQGISRDDITPVPPLLKPTNQGGSSESPLSLMSSSPEEEENHGINHVY
jgi:hypothetical protein